MPTFITLYPLFQAKEHLDLKIPMENSPVAINKFYLVQNEVI